MTSKQQNIVLFIGAGFSAPFGLPVMSNFIDKARDLYFSNPANFSEVGKTLQLIEKYSSVKNYMNINLHNIEDLLSIAYMESTVTSKSKTLNLISEFIKTVISNYTSDPQEPLVSFIQYIANINIVRSGQLVRRDGQEYHKLVPSGKRFEKCDFGIISLNYDLLIENSLSALCDRNGQFYRYAQNTNPFREIFKAGNSNVSQGIKLAKLHGSLDKQIVPPTWNKQMVPGLKNDWSLASELLTNATHVIFLGYSLPSSDNYIKYLFANSFKNNKRLKRISVITQDSDGETSGRYRNLFGSKLTFHNANVTVFMNAINKENKEIDFDQFDDSFVRLLATISSKAG